MAIARSDDGLVNATDLGLELGLAQPRIRSQLMTLEEAGLLSRMPMLPDGRKQWFERQNSAFWGACLSLYEDWGR